MLWVIESFDRRRRSLFDAEGEGQGSGGAPAEDRGLLARSRLEFRMGTDLERGGRLRGALPIDRKTDRLSNAILKLDPENATGVEWEEKKEKK